MSYSSRIFLWAPFAFLLAIAAAVSVQWWSVSRAVSAKLDAMNGHETMPGVVMRFASKTIGGYPFNVDAVLRDLRVEVQGPHGPMHWQAENFAGHALTYGRSQWIFEAAGKQHLGWSNARGERRGLAFETGSLHASAVFSGEALARFDLDIVGFNSPALAMARTQLHFRRGGDRLDAVASADVLHLSPPLRGICGDEIERVRFEGNFSNAGVFARLLEGAERWQRALDGWRKEGGRFFLAQGEITCADSSSFIDGQLALDGEKRPRGLLTAQIAGFEKLREGAGRFGAHGAFATSLIDQPSDPNPEREGRVTVRAAFRDGISYLGDTPTGMNDPLY